jgi:hypothetical protein
MKTGAGMDHTRFGPSPEKAGTRWEQAGKNENFFAEK